MSRECFVPSCPNNSTNSPDKIFVRIREDLRKKWCYEVNVEYFKDDAMYCCEDHFDPRKDLKNFYKCNMMNDEPILKPNAKLRNITVNTINEVPSTSQPQESRLRKLLQSPNCCQPENSILAKKMKYDDTVSSQYTTLELKNEKSDERKILTEFLELYRDLTCLWDLGSIDYKDKNKKNQAWELLTAKLKLLQPDADIIAAKKKIEYMRTAYKRESKKVKDSKRTGSGAIKVHTPNLWYYDLLTFLDIKDQQSRSEVDTLTNDEATFDIRGMVAPVFTPIDANGNINYDVIPSYMNFLVKEDVRGILVGGTTGEFACLSTSERKNLLKSWVVAAKPHNVKVIAQIGGVPLPDVLSMADYAKDVDADAIMTLPELYFKPRNAVELVSYLEEIHRAAPSLPLIYYHFPMMTGVNLDMREFVSLATSRINTFKGVKADLDVAMKVSDLLQNDQRIFIANHVLAPAILLGHDSSIATVTNMFPDIVKKIKINIDFGEVSEVRKLQSQLNDLVQAIFSEGDFVPAMKAAMDILTGIKVGPPRRPLNPITVDAKKRLEEKLLKLGRDIHEPTIVPSPITEIKTEYS